jgi:hypothetical protein
MYTNKGSPDCIIQGDPWGVFTHLINKFMLTTPQRWSVQISTNINYGMQTIDVLTLVYVLVLFIQYVIRVTECAWNQIIVAVLITKGPRWRSWLRHCATNWKGAGSIPDGVIGIFYWHNPFGRTVTLGSTQPLTEMSTRNISWGVKAAGA